MTSEGSVQTNAQLSQYVPGSSRPRERISNFLVTLNTNKRIDDASEKSITLADRLGDSVLRAFRDRFSQMVRFYNSTHVYSADYIQNVDIHVSPEIGVGKPQGRRLHAHVAVAVFHRSKIRLDPVSVKRIVNESLIEDHYPYRIHYVHIRGTGPTPEQYLEKYGKSSE